MKINQTWKKNYKQFQNFCTWKIQLIIAINFISSKDIDEEHAMHSKSDNIEILTCDKVDKAIKELFESLLSWFRIGLETSMKDRDFIFDPVHLLYYKYHKINMNFGGSY